ncbi:MAG: hypothetical protein EOO38_02765 [Cytophagaceae bacterium]|nr:MAG: hypothetical protein EOO38_02765 [Cytophagaceae bacterium]
MPGSEYYDREPTESEIEHEVRERRRERRSLERALVDVQKLFAYNPDREWRLTDIRCSDLVGQMEQRIKAQLYDLRER